MKIDKVTAQNFKGLRKVKIDTRQTLVVLGGKNGAGKSSVLDAIVAALGGKRAVADEPIRRGAKSGYVEVELDGLTVTRDFREDGKTSLRVRSKDGGKYGQARLDDLFSRLGPDPLAFLQAKPADQVELVQGALGIDLSGFEAREEGLIEDRRLLGRELREASAAFEAAPRIEGAPEDFVSIDEIVARLEEARDSQVELRRLEAKSRNLKTAMSEKVSDVGELRAALRREEAEADELIAQVNEAKRELDEFEPIADGPLHNQLREIESTNANVRLNRARGEIGVRVEHVQAKHDEAESALASLRAKRAAEIQAAEFPVAGVEIQGRALYFNGLPFSQASSAERLRVAVAIGIAQNPELRVLMIRDGSLLDLDSLQAVRDLAEELGAQVFIERVGDLDEDAVVIEAGEVREVPSE